MNEEQWKEKRHHCPCRGNGCSAIQEVYKNPNSMNPLLVSAKCSYESCPFVHWARKENL